MHSLPRTGWSRQPHWHARSIQTWKWRPWKWRDTGPAARREVDSQDEVLFGEAGDPFLRDVCVCSRSFSAPFYSSWASSIWMGSIWAPPPPHSFIRPSSTAATGQRSGGSSDFSSASPLSYVGVFYISPGIKRGDGSLCLYWPRGFPYPSLHVFCHTSICPAGSSLPEFAPAMLERHLLWFARRRFSACEAPTRPSWCWSPLRSAAEDKRLVSGNVRRLLRRTRQPL